MAILLIILAWLLLVSLVAGVCLAAGRGDRQLQSDTPQRAPSGAGEAAGEPLARPFETPRPKAASRLLAGGPAAFGHSSPTLGHSSLRVAESRRYRR
jgi:hypothetical protein